MLDAAFADLRLLNDATLDKLDLRAVERLTARVETFKRN